MPLRANKVSARTAARLAGFSAFLLALGMVAALESLVIAQQLNPPLDPLFCRPTSLHTTTEPPETQLTRDYRAIRILLKYAGDQFAPIRRIYEGELHVSPGLSGRSSPLMRADRAQLATAEYRRQPWSGSLREEVERIDLARGTSLGETIHAGLEAHDTARVQTAFRQFFASMLDELLLLVEQRLDRAIVVDRAIQHARRYYGEGLEAYLNLRAPEQAERAQLSLDAMERALQEIAAGNISARSWFARERGNFMQIVQESLGTLPSSPLLEGHGG
jgi:hypothetical protein